MENNQKPKLGGGILTISIIQLVFTGLGIIGFIPLLLMKDTIEQQLQSVGQTAPVLSTSSLVISLILSLILVIGIILILLRKSLGVYTYFTCVVVNIIYAIIMTGFKASLIISLILPLLMALFIYQKKEIFGFGAKADSIDPPSNM
ncbi:hypothetical protein [Clostridium sp. UBA4548]|uniref:hypothetical protein n=1 Tax=Clostridium sp. UBA4548 TaxID=1946361 RepID=UPI0025BF5C87|nr:hypothetical protein [Clostridium sp. UBA4548]